MTVDGKYPAVHWKPDPCGIVRYAKKPRYTTKQHRITCFNCVGRSKGYGTANYFLTVECNCGKFNFPTSKYCTRCGKELI